MFWRKKLDLESIRHPDFSKLEPYFDHEEWKEAKAKIFKRLDEVESKYPNDVDRQQKEYMRNNYPFINIDDEHSKLNPHATEIDIVAFASLLVYNLKDDDEFYLMKDLWPELANFS